MRKPRIIYADSRKKTDELARELRAAGLEFEYMGEPEIDKNSVYDRFFEEVYPRIGEYDLVIAHLGIAFNGRIRGMLESYPDLHIVLVSLVGFASLGAIRYGTNTPELYDRVRAADYSGGDVLEQARELLQGKGLEI